MYSLEMVVFSLQIKFWRLGLRWYSHLADVDQRTLISLIFLFTIARKSGNILLAYWKKCFHYTKRIFPLFRAIVKNRNHLPDASLLNNDKKVTLFAALTHSVMSMSYGNGRVYDGSCLTTFNANSLEGDVVSPVFIFINVHFSCILYQNMFLNRTVLLAYLYIKSFPLPIFCIQDYSFHIVRQKSLC